MTSLSSQGEEKGDRENDEENDEEDDEEDDGQRRSWKVEQVGDHVRWRFVTRRVLSKHTVGEHCIHTHCIHTHCISGWFMDSCGQLVRSAKEYIVFHMREELFEVPI